jgi:hypothetical protein
MKEGNIFQAFIRRKKNADGNSFRLVDGNLVTGKHKVVAQHISCMSVAMIAPNSAKLIKFKKELKQAGYSIQELKCNT